MGGSARCQVQLCRGGRCVRSSGRVRPEPGQTWLARAVVRRDGCWSAGKTQMAGGRCQRFERNAAPSAASRRGSGGVVLAGASRRPRAGLPGRRRSLAPRPRKLRTNISSPIGRAISKRRPISPWRKPFGRAACRRTSLRRETSRTDRRSATQDPLIQKRADRILRQTYKPEADSALAEGASGPGQ